MPAPFREELKKFFGGKSFQLCEDCQRRLENNPLRVFDCKVETCKEAVVEAPQVVQISSARSASPISTRSRNILEWPG